MATVTKVGTRWKARIRRGGISTTKSFARKLDARSWAAKIEADIDAGTYRSRKRHTLKALADRYFSLVANPTARRSIIDWWTGEFGHIELVKLTRGAIVEQLEHLAAEETDTRTRGKRRSPVTVNRYLANLSIVLSYGVTLEWLDHNPAKGIKRNTEKPRVRYLGMDGYPDDEAERLLAACKNECPTLFALVFTAMNTGARAGELLGLSWQDIDFREGTAILRGTKNGTDRFIPITGKTAEVLKAHWGDGAIGMVFTNEERTRVYDYAKTWKRAVAAAGITDLKFHDLRHHAASMLAIRGVPLNQIAHLLGHKSLAVTQRYAHLSRANVQDLGQMLDAINNGSGA